MSNSKKPDRRKVANETLGLVPIEDFVDDIAFIWGKNDRKRPLVDIWLHVVEHTSRLAEALRRERFDTAQLELAGVVFWILSFVGQSRTRTGLERLLLISKPIPDIVWSKFPAKCPVCTRDKCQCLVNLERVEGRHELTPPTKKELLELQRKKKLRRKGIRETAKAREKKGRKPVGFAGFEAMIGKVYERNIFASSINTIGFHLFEEIGEVSMAMLDTHTYISTRPSRAEYERRQNELQDEIADVFSWVFSLSRKLGLVFQNFDRYASTRGYKWPSLSKGMSISSSIMHKYCSEDPGGRLFCKLHCKSQPVCTCSVERITTHAQASKLL